MPLCPSNLSLTISFSVTKKKEGGAFSSQDTETTQGATEKRSRVFHEIPQSSLDLRKSAYGTIVYDAHNELSWRLDFSMVLPTLLFA